MGELSNNLRARAKAVNTFFDKKEKELLKTLADRRDLEKLQTQRRAVLLAALDPANIILLPDNWL